MNITTKFGIAAALLVSATSMSLAASMPTVVNIDLLNGPKLPLAVKIDKTEAKAGRFNFRIANQSKLTSQGIIVAELRSTDAKELADIKSGVIDMAKFKRVAEVDGIKGGDHFTVKTRLKAGDYVLLYKADNKFESATEAPLVVSQ